MKGILLRCESFRELGGWVLDTQSTLQLGCGYLMAHGLGVPVADAVTEVEVPESGRWTVWARTRNWNAPWTSGSAGRFRVLLNDMPLDAELGAGAADWQWQKAGEAELAAGPVRVALRDLTGFNGRCAAIRLVPQGGGGLQSAVTDAARSGDRAPPEPQWGGGLQSAGPGSVSDDPETYDLVVAGGGVAGVCAALAAARCGATSLLLQDRPVLGGCNSSEVCVAMGGRIHVGPYPNLGRIVEEIQPLFGYGSPIPPRFHEDARKESAFHIREHYATRGWEKSIPGTTPRLRLGQCAVGVETDPSNPRRIAAVLARDTRTGTVTRIRARNFCDATGDATLARLAGCETMYGREARERFGEPCASEKADRMVMGLTVQWLTEERPAPAPFPDISDWALPVTVTSDCYRTCGSWEQETGFRRDMAGEAERIRDYAMLCIFSNWNWLKNKAPDREAFARLALAWMSPSGGKRESYRVVGDHILTQGDLTGHADFPDATAAVTWDIDQHFPDPEGARAFPEPFRSAARHTGFGKPQPVPYRCLYARDCDNLFLAGRCVSASSVAFAAVRVMRTLGMLGEVVGMAAAICAETGETPREVYAKHLDALKARMAAGVPKLPQFHGGNCDHDNVRFDFKREGRHLIYNVPPDAIPPGIAADIAEAGFSPSQASSSVAFSKARETPEWFRKGVMYQIQPRAFTPEGTITAAEGILADLADLGVTVVYMCPVTVADDDPREDMWSPRQVRSGFNNPRNPYRTGDYFHVDPEYGTDDDLRSFVKSAHALGMKVLLDLVYLHCGPSARVLRDHPEYFSYDKDGKIVMAGWRFPKLNFDSRAVREYFKANMLCWLADFDVDGFRCDVADGIPLDFWEEVRDACESVKSGIVILAEGCRHANTRHAFDANYNWPVCLSWLRPILKGDSKEGYNQQWAAGGADVSEFKGVAKLRAASEQYAAKCPVGTLNMNFTENHDTANDDYEDRMEKTCGWDNQTLGLALCFAMEGIPLIYNGQEIADAHRHSIFGHSPEVTIDWSNAATPDGLRRREMIRSFATLRRSNPCMTAPGQTWLDNDAPERVLSLRRGEGAGSVVFVGNFSPEPVRVRVDGVGAEGMNPLLVNGARTDGDAFRLDPWGFTFAQHTSHE